MEETIWDKARRSHDLLCYCDNFLVFNGHLNDIIKEIKETKQPSTWVAVFKDHPKILEAAFQKT